MLGHERARTMAPQQSEEAAQRDDLIERKLREAAAKAKPPSKATKGRRGELPT